MQGAAHVQEPVSGRGVVPPDGQHLRVQAELRRLLPTRPRAEEKLRANRPPNTPPPHRCPRGTPPSLAAPSTAAHQEQGPGAQRSRRPNSSRSKFKDSAVWATHGADPASQTLAALHQDHLRARGTRGGAASARGRGLGGLLLEPGEA